VSKLAISLDYTIQIDKAVSSLSTTDILDGCYKLNPTYTFNESCAAIGRNPANGTFNGADSKVCSPTAVELGYQSTSGVDVNVNYRCCQTAEPGSEVRYLRPELRLQPGAEVRLQGSPTGTTRDCLGYYSVACASISNSTASVQAQVQPAHHWNVGDFAVGYNWRYTSAVDVEPGSGTYLPAYSHIKAYNYLDLSGVWNYSKNRLNVSVNNAANKKPPIVGANVSTTSMDSGNTFPNAYDAIGRYITSCKPEVLSFAGIKIPPGRKAWAIFLPYILEAAPGRA
jgi:hypothetical protein